MTAERTPSVATVPTASGPGGPSRQVLRRQVREARQAVNAMEQEEARARKLAARAKLVAKDTIRSMVLRPQARPVDSVGSAMAAQHAVLDAYRALAPLAAGDDITKHIEIGPDYSDVGAVMMRAATPFGESILGQALKIINSRRDV